MSLLSKIAGFFRPTPKLRNKPGGMAWVKGLPAEPSGRHNGAAVKTVRIDDGHFWAIEPRLPVFCFGLEGWIVAIADDYLEPWKDIPDGTDESLWEAAPKREVLALPVRSM